jgi:hypothetical protein
MTTLEDFVAGLAPNKTIGKTEQRSIDLRNDGRHP